MYRLSIARSTAIVMAMLLLLIGAALGAPAPTSASVTNFATASGQDPSPAASSMEVVKNFNIGSSVTVTTTIVGKRPMIATSTYVSFRSGVATTATRGAPTSFNSSRNVMTISGANSQIAIGQNDTGRSNFDSRFKHMTKAAIGGFEITSIALSNGHGGGEQALSSFL